MKNTEKAPTDEKKILEKFQKRERNVLIATGIVVFLLPLVFGVLYFARYNGLISDRFIHLGVMTLLIPLVLMIFSRRCPNCGTFMDRYRIFPKTCHKYGVKLK